MSDNLVYTEPTYTERADTAIAASTSTNGQETAHSGWERWLRGHLDIEREAIFETVIEAVAEIAAQRDRQIRELELKIAELVGAVRVLRTGTFQIRGTFNPDAKYEQHDIVAVNGSSFIATRDNPGACPSTNGAWQLLASAGSRGGRGPVGPRGERGERAPAESGFMAIHLDRASYTILLSTQDGKIHELNLRGLFQQFLADMQGKR
jgi:hypothetical protein